MAGAWPLIGRAAEADLIRRALREGTTPGIVLAGAAGVGKSRLLHEALIAAAGDGWRTSQARATRAAAAIPFGALAYLLPETLPSATALGRHNLLRLGAQALVPPGDARLVLGVDDAHLLDPASAALIGQLPELERIVLLVSLRSGEPVPDAVTALWKDRGCPRIELQPLGWAEFEELLASALPPVVAPATRDRLWAASRGNPLFLRELVAGGMELGQLVQHDGAWVWPGAFTPPARVIEIIEARMQRVSRAERRMLELVATAESIDLDLLERLAPGAAIDAAVHRGLLEVTDDGQPSEIRLAHPLYAEVLRAQMPPVRRREVARRLAEALESADRGGADLLRRATWRLESGDQADTELLVAAARRAAARADPELGERLAQAALAGGAGPNASLALGEALVQQGRFGEADEVLRAIASRGPPDSTAAAAAAARALNLFYHLDDTELALAILDHAGAAATDPDQAAELAAVRSTMLFWSGRRDQALAMAMPLATNPALPARPRLEAARTAASALFIGGQTDAAIALIDELLPLAEQARDEAPGAALYLRTGRCAAQFFAGRLREAEAGMLELDRSDEGTHFMRGAALWGLAWIIRMQGRPRTALGWARRSLAVNLEVDLHRQLADAYGEVASCLALLRDPVGARHALDRAEAADWRSPRPSGGQIARASAFVAMANGELTAAAELSFQAAELAAAAGDRIVEALALHDVARFGETGHVPAAVSNRLQEIASTFDGELVSTCAAHADAVDAANPEALLDASRRFEDQAAMLLAAEAAARAAPLFRASGRKGSALSAAGRATALAARCEGAWTPALEGMLMDVALTSREREIAGLAARRLTNRQIAELLVVSVRTVDNHLHAVYSKLGISGRDELAAILLPGEVKPDSD